MANGYGQKTTGTSPSFSYGQSGGGAVLSFNGAPTYVPGGITIDWSTVPAFAGDTTLDDGQVIPAGQKFIPYGCKMAKITASGKFGPHQAGVSDGRQTLAKGDAYCMNQTVLESDPGSEYGPGAIDGGSIFQSRLKKLNNAGTAYVADGADTTFNTTFPNFRLAEH